MAKKQKSPFTIPGLQKVIQQSFKEWSRIKKHGAGDPGYADGTNMNLIRNHISYDQGLLKKTCKEQKVRPCPIESKMKLPKHVSEDYCAPKSKAGPCRERRAAARKKRKR